MSGWVYDLALASGLLAVYNWGPYVNLEKTQIVFLFQSRLQSSGDLRLCPRFVGGGASSQGSPLHSTSCEGQHWLSGQAATMACDHFELKSLEKQHKQEELSDSPSSP